MEEPKGLIKSIFDFSFSEFVTPKVIKFLLGLFMVLNGIWVIVMIVGAFAGGAGTGILVLILSPAIYLLIMLLTRVYLELVLVAFKIVEHLGVIRKNLGGEKAPAPAPQE